LVGGIPEKFPWAWGINPGILMVLLLVTARVTPDPNQIAPVLVEPTSLYSLLFTMRLHSTQPARRAAPVVIDHSVTKTQKRA